jgi:hypothetical protein
MKIDIRAAGAIGRLAAVFPGRNGQQIGLVDPDRQGNSSLPETRGDRMGWR